jgi:hypothetical protein
MVDGMLKEEAALIIHCAGVGPRGALSRPAGSRLMPERRRVSGPEGSRGALSLGPLEGMPLTECSDGWRFAVLWGLSSSGLERGASHRRSGVACWPEVPSGASQRGLLPGGACAPLA